MKQIGTHNFFFHRIVENEETNSKHMSYDIFIHMLLHLQQWKSLLQKVAFVAGIYLCTLLVASREFLLHSPKIHSISTFSKLEKEHIVASDYFAPNIGNMKRRDRNDTLQIDSSPMFTFSNLRSTMFTLPWNQIQREVKAS